MIKNPMNYRIFLLHAPRVFYYHIPEMKCRILIFTTLFMLPLRAYAGACATSAAICEAKSTESACKAQSGCDWRYIPGKTTKGCYWPCECYPHTSGCPGTKGCGDVGIYGTHLNSESTCGICPANTYLDNTWTNGGSPVVPNVPGVEGGVDGVSGAQCLACTNTPADYKGINTSGTAPNEFYMRFSYLAPAIGYNTNSTCNYKVEYKGLKPKMKSISIVTPNPDFETQIPGAGNNNNGNTNDQYTLPGLMDTGYTWPTEECDLHMRGTVVTVTADTITSNLTTKTTGVPLDAIKCSGTVYTISYDATELNGASASSSKRITSVKYSAGFNGQYTDRDFTFIPEDGTPEKTIWEWNETGFTTTEHNIKMANTPCPPTPTVKYEITGFVENSGIRTPESRIIKRESVAANGFLTGTTCDITTTWTVNVPTTHFTANTTVYPYYEPVDAKIIYTNHDGTKSKAITGCAYNAPTTLGNFPSAAVEMSDADCKMPDYPTSEWTPPSGKVFKGWKCYNHYGTDSQSACANMESLLADEDAFAAAGTKFYEYAGAKVSNYTLVPVWEDCPTGHYCPPDGTPTLCAIGFYCPTGTTEQLPCTVGNHCPRTGMSEPDPCLAGYFCETTGIGELTDAHKCAAGTYSGPGQNKCTDCGQGFYCALDATTGLSTNETRKACRAGYYCDGYRDSAEKECGTGKYCPQETDDAGTVISGAKGPKICQRGFYCPGTTSSKQTLCEPGTYCPNTGMDTPKDCEAGYYCPQITDGDGNVTSGATSQSDCTPGNHCPAPKAATQTECPENTFCPDYNMTEYKNCPAGTFSEAGSTQESDCHIDPTKTEFCDSIGCFRLPEGATI